MWILLGTVFGASLLGSLHCIGMCGPFAMLAASNDGERRSVVPATIAYSGGRLLTYSVVGAIFGSLGLALNKGVSFTNWQQMATYVAGGIMIFVGIIALARYFGLQVKLPRGFTPITRMLQTGFSHARSMAPIQRAFALGVLTSLMPCGWLYTFAITAAGTASPVSGMVVMAVFWAGTVPILAALMLGMNRISAPIQKRLPAVMAILVIAIGAFTITHRAPVTIGQETSVVVGTNSLTEQVQNIDSESLPCCQKNSAKGN